MPETTQAESYDERRYWAFISYSHRDDRWGKWLHRKLETFRIPKRLVGVAATLGPVPTRIFPVFLDREELPVSADLSQNISEALRLSRFLVVICSPSAARSRWVNEEILSFKRLGRSDRILALIVDGEPNASDGKTNFGVEEECFPPALRYVMGPDGQLGQTRTEPIAADLRPGQDGRDNAFLKLVAGILGMHFDTLRNREHERKIRRLRIVIAAVSLLLLLFAALGVALYFQRARTEAEYSRSDYIQAVEAIGKDTSAEALAFLARAVRTNPGNAPASDLLLSLLGDQLWFLPMTPPMPLGDEIGIAVFDRDASRLFVSEGIDTWRIIEPVSGKEELAGKVTPARVGAAAISPDGQRLAIASGTIMQNALHLWNLQNSTPFTEPVGLSATPASLTFSPDGKTLLVPSNQTLEQRDSTTGAEIRPSIDHDKPVMCAAYTPDGSHIVSSALFDTFFWNSLSGVADGPPLRHDAIPQSLSIALAGDRLAIALGDSTAQVFGLPDRERLGQPVVHRSDINNIKFSRDGQSVLTCSNDRTALLWDAATGRRQAESMRHEQPVIACVLSADEDTVLTVSGGQGKPAQLNHWRLNRTPSTMTDLPHEARVASFSISPDGARIVSCSVDGQVKVWDARTHALIAGPLQSPGEVNTCLFSPDGQRVASAAGTIVTVWDLSGDARQLLNLKHDSPLNTLAFSPDGKLLVSALSDGSVWLWDPKKGTQKGPPLRHESAVLKAVFSPDGRSILTGSNDGVVQLWDVATRMPRGEPMRHTDAVTVAHFSADGQRVVTGSMDGVARVWDAGTGTARTPPLQHDSSVTETLFSPDGATILTAAGEYGRQGSARVWDAHTGRPLTDPIRHPEGVESAVLNPDGDSLITGAFDGKLRVWDSHTGKPRALSVSFGEPIVSIQFLPPPSSSMVIGSGDRLAVVDRFDPGAPAPEWLAGLAERLGGLRFNPEGLLESVSDRSFDSLIMELRGHEPRDEYERFGRWFFSNLMDRKEH
jgi:WD40 repeat protein